MTLARLACLVSFFFLVSPGSAHGHTLTVDCLGQADFANIQGAVDAASAGDTVSILPCTYDETVTIGDKRIVLVGAGRQTTIISSSGSDPTLQCGNQGLTLKGMTILKEPPEKLALTWQDGDLNIEDSSVQGKAVGGINFGAIRAKNCSMRDLDVKGGQRRSITVDSRFSSVTISGIFLEAENELSSLRCQFNSLSFGNLAGAVSFQDSIGTVFLNGNADMYNHLEATNSTIGELRAVGWAPLLLEGCRVGLLSYAIYDIPGLSMKHCIVSDSCIVRNPYVPVPTSPKLGTSVEAGYVIEHNTFLGPLIISQPASAFATFPNSVQNNIFAGPASITSPFKNFLLYANCFSTTYHFNLADPSLPYENLFADPQFCASPLDLRLKSTSPCLGTANDGGNIGALGRGCGPVDVRTATWGKLKALFHN